MKKSFIFSFCLFLSLLGCKQLEVKPPFEIPVEDAFNNVNDLEVMVNGCYQALQSPNCYGAAYKMIPDIFSDFVTVSNQALAKGNTGSTSLFNVYQRQTFGSTDGVWRDSYSCINRCNQVIDAILTGKVKDKTGAYQINADRILGEAYGLRALMHFDLQRLYAHQYGINENQANSGVLLMTEPTTGRVAKARATTAQVFAQIESDLKEAVRLLPESKRPEDIFTYGGREGGRLTKFAALALLARVHYQKATDADDDMALLYADSVIRVSGFNIASDTGGVDFLVKSNFEIGASTLFQVVNVYNAKTREINSTSKTLLDHYYYQDDEETRFPTVYQLNNRFRSGILGFNDAAGPGVVPDQRIEKGTVFSGGLRYTKKYQGDLIKSAMNVPIIRMAEMYLIRAELNVKKNTQQAKNDLAAIRENAYKVRVNGNLQISIPESLSRNSINQLEPDTLLKAIINERIIELNLEGDRLHHFKRVAKRYGFPEMAFLRSYDSRQRSILRDVKFDDNAILFQIPDAEIAANPLVVRNP